MTYKEREEEEIKQSAERLLQHSTFISIERESTKVILFFRVS
jgi:hypothetical protein